MVASRKFTFLAAFAAVHILKLNFVVTSVNAQLALLLPDDAARAAALSRAFGAMLPFGFVSAPLTASLLSRDAVAAFAAANVFGVVYGAANLLLLLLTLPLFGARAFLREPAPPKAPRPRRAPPAGEKTTLVRPSSLSGLA